MTFLRRTRYFSDSTWKEQLEFLFALSVAAKKRRDTSFYEYTCHFIADHSRAMRSFPVVDVAQIPSIRFVGGFSHYVGEVFVSVTAGVFNGIYGR